MPSPPDPLPASLAETFVRRFGRPPRVAARAPGRINLIGEHTDYNEGLVLPCAIDRDTWVLAAARDDARVRAFSRELGEAEFDVAATRRTGGWIDHVQGIWHALARFGRMEEGTRTRGADLAIASDVPLGSGLSSSAALGVAVATAVDACFELGLSAEDCAGVAHRSESGFVGVGCGVMDQLASALGRRDCALRIDCRTLEVEAVALPQGELAFLVAHSGVSRSLQGAGYAERRHECERALAAARESGVAPSAAALRDLLPPHLPALERQLDPVLFRRARHVILENERVDAMRRALENVDLDRAGSLLKEGMRSLRDDFEVSCPELDALCESGDGQPGVYGSRLTGAGFGGCTLHLVAPAAAESAAAALGEGFERRFGRRPELRVVRSADGASAASIPPAAASGTPSHL